MTFEFHRQIFKPIRAQTTIWPKTIDLTSFVGHNLTIEISSNCVVIFGFFLEKVNWYFEKKTSFFEKDYWKKKPLYCLLIYDIMSTIWSLYSKEIFNTIIMACGIISHKIDFVKHFFTCFVFICNTSISIVFNKICAIQNSQCNMLECNDRILSSFLKKRWIQASLVSLKST